MKITNYFINKNTNTFDKENDKNFLNTNILSGEKTLITNKTLSKQEDYFINQEVKYWYPIYRDSEGKVAFSFPSLLNDKKRIIYEFKNEKKQIYLIGETGIGLIKRCSQYATFINKTGSEKWVKEKGRKAFLNDIKDHPEHFKVGVLAYLQDDEDLTEFEKKFIKYKRKIYPLYNDREGGGGGVPHTEEEPTPYAIYKDSVNITPKKYYRFSKNYRGQVRPVFSPGFKGKIAKLRQEMEKKQEFAYVIKHLPTGKRYIGVTGGLEKRLKMHGYCANYSNEKNDKYNPSYVSGLIDKAISKEPENFAFGVLPIKSLLKIKKEERNLYQIFYSIKEVETALIKIKKAHKSQSGYNCNWGGGGSISQVAKKNVAKTLTYD